MLSLNRPIVKDSSANDKTEVLFSETTIEGMEEYFHVHDRDVLLKYLRDTMVASADR
jgi:hypothetical protein